MVFTKFRMTHKLLLITQDNDLAKDIIALNSNKSVRANPVHVKRINQYGFLSNFTWNADNTKNDSPKRNKRQNNEEDLDEDEVFQICKSVTTLDDSRLVVSHIPAENEIVYTSRDPIKLESKVAAGGEGIIYTTNTPYVAKIYKKENNTKRKYEKIKLMLSKEIECEGVCYPVAALYNSNKEFVGYMMPKAKGKELQKSIFIKPLFLKNFPNWKKRDTVELCITILEKIKYLHDRNIVMGDINPANILVVSPKEVYFVDTDSYQVENFPCPVGTNNYTAPEIQRKHFSDFLRTMGNENFAVATLLFMIMLPGKPPYSQQGGEDPINNIIKMDFSYPFGDSSNKKTPDGPWRYIWSHLTYDLKKAFYNTFRKGGDYSTENTRLTADEWLPIFTYYLELLDSGKFGKQDKMSEKLFPTRHKKNPNVEYTTCKLCGNEVSENQCQNGICRDCLNKGEVYRCKKCGKEILYTNYQKYVKNAKRFDVCPECFEYGNKVRIRQNCVDCGRQFEITNNQYDFYTRKGFDIPKRCKSCRDAKKNRSYSSSGGYSSQTTHTTSSHNSGSSGSNGSFCFISTVICEYFGKDDNCVELSTLRGYRDNWLRNQPDGQQLIAEYYNNAPFIVSKLKTSANYTYYCQYLWDNYLQPCLVFIENKQFESCKGLYIEMYQYLRGIILKGGD
ncbi:hypothetical protein UF10_01805 [Peptostreptococcus russellii]|uniref:Protein kinase domain-containing protein n=1 Tax=Peptostreptococcus russellii TaxID=215200 RepID=A0A2P7Q2L0_9FIRM|nr:hypothetical protein UF10_01805 [Peptostreptococcus russellii]